MHKICQSSDNRCGFVVMPSPILHYCRAHVMIIQTIENECHLLQWYIPDSHNTRGGSHHLIESIMEKWSTPCQDRVTCPRTPSWAHIMIIQNVWNECARPSSMSLVVSCYARPCYPLARSVWPTGLHKLLIFVVFKSTPCLLRPHRDGCLWKPNIYLFKPLI